MRMEQCVETLACCGIGEDRIGERPAIEYAPAYGMRPDPRDLHETVAIGSDDFARDRVGVDDKRAKLSEYRRNRTFSSSDAAGQPNAHSRSYVFAGSVGASGAAAISISSSTAYCSISSGGTSATC